MDNYFTQTSTEPYNRHRYKIVYYDKPDKFFDYYEDVTKEWYLNKDAKHVEVIDIIKKKKEKRGFK